MDLPFHGLTKSRYNLGLASIGNFLEAVGSYANNSDLKEFFKSCVDIYAFININHRNERNILSNLWHKQKIAT